MFKLFDEEPWLPVPPALTAPGGEFCVPCVPWVLRGALGSSSPFRGQLMPQFPLIRRFGRVWV